MKHFKLFEEFVNDLDKNSIWNYLKKVQIFTNVLGFKDVEDQIGEDMKNYWKDFYKEDEYKYIDKDLPLLFWRNTERCADLIKKADLPPKKIIYNYSKNFDPGKSDLAKKIQKIKADWYPKTVLNKSEVKNLKFPIIAKKDDTFQSKGVEKFDTIEDIGNKQFDVYQECIDIDNEYRVMLFKGKNDEIVKAFGLWHRKPNNTKSKSLRLNEDSKKGEEKSKFQWRQIPLKEFKKWDQIKPIANSVFDFYPNLNVLGLDIAVDKNGKAWCIEHNETPGLVGNTSIRIYKYIYEDCFGEKMPNKIVKLFQLKAGQYLDYYKNYKDDYVNVEGSEKQFTDLKSEIIL